MRTENQCPPGERFLFAEEYFSDEAISIWQAECISRCRYREKDNLYEKYINWKRGNNEIAVFTLYAYADFKIPKKFDCIFRLDKPGDFVITGYELTQSIHEAWLPVDHVGDGHKHLCVFKFENEVPGIFGLLHKGEHKFSTAPKGQIKLGFCCKNDYDEIKLQWEEHIQKINTLKDKYANKWFNHLDDE